MKKELRGENTGSEQNEAFFNTSEYRLIKDEVAESVKEIMSPELPFPHKEEKDKLKELGIKSNEKHDIAPLINSSLSAMEKYGVDPGERDKIFWNIVADSLGDVFDRVAESEIHPLLVVGKTQEADSLINREISAILKRLSSTIFHKKDDISGFIHTVLKNGFYDRISLKSMKNEYEAPSKKEDNEPPEEGEAMAH